MVFCSWPSAGGPGRWAGNGMKRLLLQVSIRFAENILNLHRDWPAHRSLYDLYSAQVPFRDRCFNLRISESQAGLAKHGCTA